MGGLPSPPRENPTKQQFSCYNPIKISFLAVVIASMQFFFLTPYFLYTQVMLILVLMDVQYLQNVVIFQKGSNCQMHFSLDSNHPIKKSPHPSKIYFPHVGGISPAPLNTIWKTLEGSTLHQLYLLFWYVLHKYLSNL